MKTTKADILLAQRFPAKENVLGFGASPATAGVTVQQVERLVALGLLKMTSRGSAVAGTSQTIHRDHTHFVQAL